MRLNIILFKKSPISEWLGAVAGATSTNGLNQTGSEPQCHETHAQSDSFSNSTLY